MAQAKRSTTTARKRRTPAKKRKPTTRFEPAFLLRIAYYLAVAAFLVVSLGTLFYVIFFQVVVADAGFTEHSTSALFALSTDGTDFFSRCMRRSICPRTESMEKRKR